MRVRGSYLWAAAILVGLGGWLASGMLMEAHVADDPSGESAAETQPELQAVRVERMTARERRSELVVRGRSEADERVQLRAETAGRVISTPYPKGSFVEKGSVLCEIDMGDRKARLAEAQAAVDQAKLDHNASVSLKEKGFSAATDAAAKKARLDAAMAMLNQAEIDIERTRTLAPFDGVLEERNAKVGVWLAVGETCATLVDLDPIQLVGYVSERDVGKLEVGMPGTGHLVTGETVEGEIAYISATADPETRTFRVELHADNAERRFRDGVTAEIIVPLEAEEAHHFSPAILTLDDEGRIGVRIVDGDDRVRFMPVEIIADGPDGVWVSGLPEEIRVITVGQEYVTAGQKVRPILADTIAGRS